MAEKNNNGIVIGVVSNLDDPASLGRVKVKFPHLGGQESDWARLASPMAGAGRGALFIPEVDDEVLVAFEHGDPRHVYVLGAMWSQADKPPKTDGKKKENNWRMIQSRSGHIILLDDTKGKEKIVIMDKDGKRHIVIDSSAGKIQILADAGEIEIKAAGNVNVEGADVTVHAKKSLTLSADGDVTIQGKMVNIN